MVPLGLFMALVPMSCSHSAEEHAETTQCVATQAMRQDTTVVKPYVGQIQAIQHIEVRALEKGYIQAIYVKEGQTVRKGQIMFQIMPMIYQAESKKAEAEVNFANIEYLNTKRLADGNIVSSNELALAKAKLDKAQAEWDLAKAHLAFTELRAPFDGIIDRFHVRLGSLVDEGELLTTMADNSKMWVYFNVPESEYLDYAMRRQQNQELAVTLQMANGQLFDQNGVVETIEADFDNETGNIPFRATFNNPKLLLRHGETGNILMAVNLKSALLIPQEATFEVLDKKFVFVLDEHNIVRSRQITTGQELQHLFVVTGGLSEKDKVLVEGIRKVKNGDKVECSMRSMTSILRDLNHLHAE